MAPSCLTYHFFFVLLGNADPEYAGVDDAGHPRAAEHARQAERGVEAT